MIRIIAKKKRNDIVVFNYIINAFYKLTNCNFDKTFIINNRIIVTITKILFKRKHFILIIVKLMY